MTMRVALFCWFELTNLIEVLCVQIILFVSPLLILQPKDIRFVTTFLVSFRKFGGGAIVGVVFK
ncbi:hypothetical protein HanXRQr2_Chr14g0659421 [Helianthus annuus]|uniref:Uncharacterized protein n=1 Tax=Helianthus annuus TaxID=4232 RepID=A0A9K3EDB4_HELAN|nr:hypothetical protein HanXRQr2_Chr14g0659421 [Helianthus annuus]KAJ0841619.1 hypothetical protein HanPSC8_Chr14g0632491 [Helianthus annuus]